MLPRYLIALALALLLLLPAVASAWLPRDADGWSIIEPGPDARIVYVARSGHDGNDGLSPDTPKATIAAGLATARNGAGDVLRIRGGDQFDEILNLEQRSNLTVEAYGQGRPVLQKLYSLGRRAPVERIVIRGIEFRPVGRDQAMFVLGWGGDVLVEDCAFVGGAGNAWQGTGPKDDAGVHAGWDGVTFRRSIIVDAWQVAGNGHAAGVYATGIDNLAIEECVFDHNGWSSDPNDVGGQATMFNHNIYLSGSNGEAAIRGNLIARGASHGAQVRPGGTVEDNYFFGNAIPFFVAPGNSYRGRQWVYRNTIEGARDIHNLPRGYGSDVFPSIDGEWRDNAYISRGALASAAYSPIWIENRTIDSTIPNLDPSPFPPGTPASVRISRLYAWDWVGTERANQHTTGTSVNGVLRLPLNPVVAGYYTYEHIYGQGVGLDGESVQHVDPTRSLTRYAAEVLGMSAAEDLIQWHRNRDRLTWDAKKTAKAASAWVRNGFEIAFDDPAVTPDLETPETPENPGESDEDMSELIDTPEARALRARMDATILSLGEQTGDLKRDTRDKVLRLAGAINQAAEDVAAAPAGTYSPDVLDALDGRRVGIIHAIDDVSTELQQSLGQQPE